MKVVLLCGGGKAIHVLAAYLSAQPDTHVTILSLFPCEANTLRDAIPKEGIRCINDLSYDVIGKPNAVIEKAEDVPKNLDIVIFALPSFTHELYFKALKPYLKPGVTIGAMPGKGGFESCASHNLGSEFVLHSNLFALETLPRACRVIEYGKSVEVSRTEEEVEVIISPKYGTTKDGFVTDVLRDLIERLPLFDPSDAYSDTSMINPKSAWHPAISHGFYRKTDIIKPFDASPLIYHGAVEYSCNELDQVSDEEMEFILIPLEKYPSLNSPHDVSSIRNHSDKDGISDTPSIHTVLRSNKVYRDLLHQIRDKEVDGKKKYSSNFKYRYFIDVAHRTRPDRRDYRACRRTHTPHG